VALVGLRVPYEAARLLQGIDVPGDKLATSNMHVTILYLGHGISVIEVAKAMCAAHQVTSRTSPFLCGIKDISSFPVGKDGIPVICPIHSPGLHVLNAALRAEFDRLGVEYSKKWPEYEPHVTLSYITNSSGSRADLSYLPGPLTWTASEMVIWGGDEGDEVLSITMPFVLGPVERAARQISGVG